jgi:hypothetical protein
MAELLARELVAHSFTDEVLSVRKRDSLCAAVHTELGEDVAVFFLPTSAATGANPERFRDEEQQRTGAGLLHRFAAGRRHDPRG